MYLTLIVGSPGAYRERLFKFVEAQSVELSYSERIAPAKGLSHGGKITLLSGMQPAEEFSTLVHEIAHEMLHRGTFLQHQGSQLPDPHSCQRLLRVQRQHEMENAGSQGLHQFEMDFKLM